MFVTRFWFELTFKRLFKVDDMKCLLFQKFDFTKLFQLLRLFYYA